MLDRISATRRPEESPIGFQTWTRLGFLHWRVAPEQLRALLPDELEIDTFDGSAWLGLVPFYMSGVRPWWSPAVPGVSNFPETNLRTYVHRRGAHPGVWFFSLDATKRLAVWLGRTFWHLNYKHAQMSLEQTGDRVCYHSLRNDGVTRLDLELQCEPLPPGVTDGVAAEPGSLEFFLAERYLLYTTNRSGRLYRGQVHHRPYPLRPAQVVSCRQTLSAANGIDVADRPDHALFSPGVTVDIFPLRPVES